MSTLIASLHSHIFPFPFSLNYLPPSLPLPPSPSLFLSLSLPPALSLSLPPSLPPSLPTPSWFVYFVGSPCWPTQPSWDTVWKKSSCPGKNWELPAYTFLKDLYLCGVGHRPSVSIAVAGCISSHATQLASFPGPPSFLSLAVYTWGGPGNEATTLPQRGKW